jgi:carbamoyl-phosphate synthase large subunit
MATIRETQQFCGDGRYIIEEFIEGDEISVEGIVQNHTVEIIQLTDKMVTDPPYNVELGHIQPSRYEYLKEKIRSVLQKVVTDSGLNDCAIHPELKIKDDEITIIEIGPRLGGDFITSHLVPLSTGINMEELVIKIATGTPFTLTMKEMAAMVSYLNFETGCKVTNILSLNNIRETFGHVVDYQFTLRIGESIPLITNSLNRYGHFIVQSAKADGLISLAKEINSFIFDRVCEC